MDLENAKLDPRQRTQSMRQAVATLAGVVGLVTLGSTLVVVVTGFYPMDSMLVIGPVVFAFSLIAVWQVLAFRSIRNRMSVKSGQFFSVTVGYAVALIAIMGGGHFILAQNPVVWDVTDVGIHSLSDQSKAVVKAIKKPVRITAFYERASTEALLITDIVERYQRENPLLSFRLLSPSADIGEVRKYKVSEDGPRIIVETDWEDDEKRKDARFAITANELRGEELVTNALIKATQRQRKKVVMLTGHGEPDLRSDDAGGLSRFAKDLVAEGYDVISLNLVTALRIPDDAALVLIPGPRQALLAPETRELSRYLDRGGRVGIWLEPERPHGLASVVGAYGIQVNDDVILDVSSFGQMFGSGPDTATATTYAEHPITRGFNSGVTLFSRARSVDVNPGTQTKVERLVKTGAASWGETDFASILNNTAEWNPGEAKGPVTIGLAATAAVDNRVAGKVNDETRLLVFGDSSFATNRFRNTGANRDLALNSVAWLAQSEERIAVRPHTRGRNVIILSNQQRDRIAFFVLYLLPVLLLSLGLGIWLVRKQR